MRPPHHGSLHDDRAEEESGDATAVLIFGLGAAACAFHAAHKAKTAAGGGRTKGARYSATSTADIDAGAASISGRTIAMPPAYFAEEEQEDFNQRGGGGGGGRGGGGSSGGGGGGGSSCIGSRSGTVGIGGQVMAGGGRCDADRFRTTTAGGAGLFNSGVGCAAAAARDTHRVAAPPPSAADDDDEDADEPWL